jgi:hypothetical protein
LARAAAAIRNKPARTGGRISLRRAARYRADGERQAGAGGETTESEDQFDVGVQEILRLVEAENARAIARRRRRFRRRAWGLLAAVLALCALEAFRVGFGAGAL